jgi:hypothetical protein
MLPETYPGLSHMSQGPKRLLDHIPPQHLISPPKVPFVTRIFTNC